MRVKICGLTRPDDALLAHGLGAWALGFILYPGSKRFVAKDRVRDIITQLPSPARPVGVFVNQTQEAVALAKDAPFFALQLHGDETPDDCARAKAATRLPVIKALRPEKPEDLRVIATYKDAADYILIDTPGAYGGTGKAGDWALAATAAAQGIPLILAGGLGAQNIAAAAKQVPFFAADLASGVESAPGVKDAEKMKTLFDTVKGTPHAA